MDQFIREIWYVICVFHQALPSPTVFNRDEWIKHVDNYDTRLHEVLMPAADSHEWKEHRVYL